MTVDNQIILQPRPTWLVAYEGIAYKTPASCACYDLYFPNTTVVLDAQDGQVLLTYGSYS
jgi:hypothetical protein